MSANKTVLLLGHEARPRFRTETRRALLAKHNEGAPNGAPSSNSYRSIYFSGSLYSGRMALVRISSVISAMKVASGLAPSSLR